MGGDTMFDSIDRDETPHPSAQSEAAEWRPLLSLIGARPDDLRHWTLGDPSETWEYCNAKGLLEGYVCRFETTGPDGTPGKEFRPRRYGALAKNGKTRTGWHWKGWGEGRPLYGLPELLARSDAPVVVVEGERKADAARRLFPDSAAVSPMNGAKSPEKTDWAPLDGRNVTIWPDHDEPGLALAEKVSKLALDAGAASVAVVTIPQEWPEKWDLADAPPDGAGPETLTGMLKSAEPRVSSKPARRSKPPGKPASEQEIQTEVCRLVTLSRIKYELVREDVAAKLGVRVSMLDRLVKIERGEVDVARREDDTAPRPGRPVDIPEVEPWPEPVDGAKLLDGLATTLQKYVVVSDVGADAIALWVVHSHAHDAFDMSPKLWLKSVEKRSGKTRLCEGLDRVVALPLLVSGISPASLLRIIETRHPTCILDEMDPALKKSPEAAEALRGIMNSGFSRRSARYIMNVPVPGGGYEPRQFSTWAPQVLSGIGELPDTVRDRSIPVEMKRRRKDEPIARLRQRDGKDLCELGRKAARWAKDHMEELRNASPEMPEALNDRAADAWEPLFAIADLAGGKWRERAEAAAADLSADEAGEDGSVKVKLLADIHAAFTERNVDRMSSDDIVTYLAGLEGRPWPEWGRQRKPISKNQVAELLRPLHVTPTTLHLGKDRDGNKLAAKGYYLSAFRDVFSRLLSHFPLSPGSQTVTSLPIQDSCGSEPDFRPLPEPPGYGPENAENPSISAKGNEVTVQNPTPREMRDNGADFDESSGVGAAGDGGVADREPPPGGTKRGRMRI